MQVSDCSLTASIPLKRELSTQDWEGLIREVRARVEMDGESLYS